MSGTDKSPLSDKRKLFIAEYLKDLNATRAAERAGYTYPNKQGPYLVNLGVIRREIDRQLRAKVMTPDEVLERLSSQAKAEYSIYIEENGTVDLEQMLADGKGHLIKGTKWDRDGHLVVEFYDGQKALSLMAKYQGLLSDTAVNLNVDMNSLTEEQLERIAAGDDVRQVLVSNGSDNSSGNSSGNSSDNDDG
jgi:phage terminase small subunit